MGRDTGIGRWQGPLPKGWSPHDRYIYDRVVSERMAAEEHSGQPWQPAATRRSPLADVIASTGTDSFCRTCFGSTQIRGDVCWRCDGTGVDAARIIAEHGAQFITGIATRYIDGAA